MPTPRLLQGGALLESSNQPTSPRLPSPFLREEEAAGDMPNLGKKKRNISGGGADGTGDGVNPALALFLTTMKNDLIDTTTEALGRLKARLESNESNIANLGERIKQGEKALERKIASEVFKQCMAASATAGKGVPLGQQDRREAAYNFCRRSLKIWPVSEQGGSLEDAVKTFLKGKLSMSDRRIQELGRIEVSALPGRVARDRKEVLATFEAKEDRDIVKANGINLAGQREVGMSIHVPGHLTDNLVALNGLGYSIKQKNPGVKRVVKFDDFKQDLFMNIFVAGQWKRVSPGEVRQVMKEVPLTSSGGGSSISVPDLLCLIKGGGPEEGSGAVKIQGDSIKASQFEAEESSLGNRNFMVNKTQMNMININSRSPWLKLSTIIQCFFGLNLMLAIMAETWFAAGSRLDLQGESLLLGHGFKLHTLNRDPLPSGVAYGGVAVILRESISKSQLFKFHNPEKYKVLQESIRVTGLNKKLYIIVAYIPPGYTVPRWNACLRHIADLVLTIKNQHENPFILVAGDFNQWKVGSCLAEFSNMEEVSTSPIWGRRKIDKIFTNWAKHIKEEDCFPPLQTDEADGSITQNDHGIRCPKSPARSLPDGRLLLTGPTRPGGEETFMEEIANRDWPLLLSRVGTNAKSLICLGCIVRQGR